MPTVMRQGRVRYIIYPSDHRPAHVHLIGPEGEAIFNLNCPNGPCALRENYGVKSRPLNDIERLTNKHIKELCRAWEEIHGIA